MSRGLTGRQEEILRFVQEFIRIHGFPPSIREIGKGVKITSLRGVTVHLDALARKGYIARGSQPRSIKIQHPSYRANDANVVVLPLLGTIAAGTGVVAEENIEAMLPVPTELVRNIRDAFLLRVRGDSMRDEGILPRDLVIIKPQETARERDLVAVLLGDEATVKRISFKKDDIVLHPSNPDYEPIVAKREDARIIGKVIGLLRDYDGVAW
jgi:repressor LexA